jgi:putative tryptophan/tyrosine transport system substrate-binding protein
MRRRGFITLLGGAAATWPLAGRAQQRAMPVIGYLDPRSPEPNAKRLEAFRKGLSETGFVEGRNVAIEFRWGHGDFARLPELVSDLVRRRVAVIAVPSSNAAVRTAKGATTTIPVIFSTDSDPVQAGLVASLNRPGGNVTGLTSMDGELVPKRLGLLQETLPVAARVAVLVFRNNFSVTEPVAENPLLVALQEAASRIGTQIETFYAGTDREIDTAFASLVQKRADALLVLPFVFFINRRVQLATLAAYHRVPAIYSHREIAEAGGLMSYGANQTDLLRQLGVYTGRVLKGAKPADLPVMQPTKFEFVINLQTARMLGLTVPPTLLAIADEVIE